MSKPKPMPSYWALAEEVTHLHGQLDQLKAENAKLRKLVRDIYVEMWHCGEWLEPYEQRMQELGIEVD